MATKFKLTKEVKIFIAIIVIIAVAFLLSGTSQTALFRAPTQSITLSSVSLVQDSTNSISVQANMGNPSGIATMVYAINSKGDIIASTPSTVTTTATLSIPKIAFSQGPVYVTCHDGPSIASCVMDKGVMMSYQNGKLTTTPLTKPASVRTIADFQKYLAGSTNIAVL
jgi:hypothetical protein